MRKNKMMRAASGLLVAVLLSTCAISGTFAKYTTSADGTDSARVAKWGFQPTTIDLTNLFDDAYATTGEAAVYNANGNTVKATSERTDVIAPGTKGSATFGFTYGGDNSVTAPEVAYKFTVDTTGSNCASSIQSNDNIKWRLDGGTWGSWTDLITAIRNLSGAATGEQKYNPGDLPTAFNTSNPIHTVEWKWIFDENAENTEKNTANQDATDTEMGNAAELAKVTLKITVTATQID